MKPQCSVCESEDVRPTDGQSFVEKKIFPLVRLWPYRCRNCRSRFFRFSLQNGDGLPSRKRVKRRKKKAQEKQFPEFFSPPDEQDFRELIAEIAKEEEKIFGNHRNRDVNLSGNHNQDFHEDELKIEEMN